MSQHRRWRLMAGAVLSALFLWLAARGVSWPDVAGALGSAHYGLLAVAAGSVIVATALRAWCWRRLLVAARSPVPFGPAWRILVIGQLLNIGVPARAGDAARVYLMAAAGPMPKTSAATSLVVEKFFDATALLLLLVPISIFVEMPPVLANARRGLVVAAGILPLVVFGLAWRREWLIDRLARPRAGASSGWMARLLRHAQHVLQSLAVVRSWRGIVLLQTGYLRVWLILAGVNYVVFRAAGLAAPAVAALVVLVALQLGTSVPSTPGKVGVFQYLCVLALAPFGVPRDQALTYGVLLHLVAYGPVIALGGAWLWAGMTTSGSKAGQGS